MIAFHHAPAWGEIWLLLPALAAIIVFVSALAIFLSAVNVYLRDTQHLVEVLLVAWFWANPGGLRLLGRDPRRARAAHHLLHSPHQADLALFRQPRRPRSS